MITGGVSWKSATFFAFLLQICATQRHWLHGGVDRSTQYVGVDDSNHTMLTNTDLATDFMIQTKFELWFGTILIETYHRTQLATGKFHTYGHFGWFWSMCNYFRNMPCAQKMPPMKRFHVVVETTNPFNSRWSATAASAGSTLVNCANFKGLEPSEEANWKSRCANI